MKIVGAGRSPFQEERAEVPEEKWLRATFAKGIPIAFSPSI